MNSKYLMNKPNSLNNQTQISINDKNDKNNGHNKYRENNLELIKYIYDTINISQFKYDILKYENQLSKFVSETAYYISPNFYGKNCFLVFKRFRSKYFAYLIDKKQLSYTFDKIQADNLFLIYCNVDIDITIYNGTIFDGIYVKRDISHEYIITDVYQFRGTSYTNDKIKNKLYEIQLYLDNINTNTIYKEMMNSRINLKLKVNKLRPLDDLKDLVNDIPNETNYQIRGIVFYPEISGTKLIYLFDDENQNIQQTPLKNRNDNKSNISLLSDNSSSNGKNINNSNNFINKSDDNVMKKSRGLVKKVYIAKSNKPIYAILEMQATRLHDIYKMYAVEQIKNGDHYKLKKCQMDIAYVPNINKSTWCREVITKSHKGTILVKCIWRDEKKKMGTSRRSN